MAKINRIGILIALVSQMIKLIAVLHSILFQNDKWGMHILRNAIIEGLTIVRFKTFIF